MDTDKIRELNKHSKIALAYLEELQLSLTGEASGYGLQAAMHALFEGSDDVVFREFELAVSGQRCLVVYVDGLVDKKDVEERIIQPLMWGNTPEIRALLGQVSCSRGFPAKGQALKDLMNGVISAGEIKLAETLSDLSEAVLSGRTVFMMDAVGGGVIISNPGWRGRPVGTPQLEFTLIGPKEAFSETLVWNTALIRRRVKDPNLKIKRYQVGRRSRTDVALIYIEGIVNPSLVQEAEKRIRKVDIDGITDAAVLERLIEDAWWSPFPTLSGSERPDVVVSALLEGRVAILADNSSRALMAPTNFTNLFQTPDDAYDLWLSGNVLRMVRFLAGFLALITPSTYVALTSFNPGLLPTRLVLKLVASREGVAIPVIGEALFAQISLELLKEAGLRMPAPVGQIFGVVGGLILGELGVRAGLFSELMIITIAITAVASFSIPTIPFGTSLRLLGLPVLISTTVFGLFGLSISIMIILAHLVTLKSFGVPYLVPGGFYGSQTRKDLFWRKHWRSFFMRPEMYRPIDKVMQNKIDVDWQKENLPTPRAYGKKGANS